MPSRCAPRILARALALLLGGLCLAGCGGDDVPPGPGDPVTRGPVEGLRGERAIQDYERAHLGRWSLAVPDRDPPLEIHLALFDNGTYRFVTKGRAAGEPTLVNEGLWAVEGLDRILLTARRSQGMDQVPGEIPATVLLVDPRGLVMEGDPTKTPLTRPGGPAKGGA